MTFLPRRANLEQRLRNLAKEAPLSFLLTKQIIDSAGQVVATVGSIEEDLDGNLVSQVVHDIQFSSIFLEPSFSTLKADGRLTAQSFYDEIAKSGVFDPVSDELLKTGLELYFAGQFAGSIHVLLPQIESLIRKFVASCNAPVMKPSRLNKGIYDYKLLDELLREDCFKSVFGQDVAFYFRVMLTDRRGLNLRNGAAHGLLPAEMFTSMIAERLLHILMIVGILRSKS